VLSPLLAAGVLCGCGQLVPSSGGGCRGRGVADRLGRGVVSSCCGVGGDQGLDGEVVHRPGQSAGDLVDQRDRVVAEQRVGAVDQLQVVGTEGRAVNVLR